MASIKPLGNRILVKRLEAEAVSAGGIVLPDSAQEKPQEAEVTALGTGGTDENGKEIVFDVKVGDKVLFGKYSGTEIKIEGGEHIILREEEVLGVVDLAVGRLGQRLGHVEGGHLEHLSGALAVA